MSQNLGGMYKVSKTSSGPTCRYYIAILISSLRDTFYPKCCHIFFGNAQCTEIEQKIQKIVSKSWFIYPIWTIGTYKLLLVGLEFTVKRSTYIKKLAVMFNFCSYPLPWLGWNARTTMLRRNKASHCFLELNWDV